MTKVFCLNPPGDAIRTGRLVRRSKISTQSWPPIFLAYATGVLEKLGYECVLYDASVMKTSAADTLKMINDYRPEVVALYWSYDTRSIDLPFAEMLANKYRVILVGPWSAHYPDALKDCPSVESMTFGEFEYTLPKLIEGLSAQGVTYRDGTHISQRGPYSTTELDWMPFVTDVYRRHLQIDKYHQTSFRHPFIDIFSSRGCPSRCAFCSVTNGMYQLHQRRWQKRSLKNVIEELWFIKNELPQIKQVFFQDDTLPTPWALTISQAMIDERLKLCWGCYSRADKTYEQIMKMKESGCRTFHVGYEVPLQGVLDEIKKDLTVEQMEQFAAAMKKAKMWQSASFMIFPWLTPDQIKYMTEWAKKINPTRINVAQLQAYPNVPIIDVVARHREAGGKMMDFNEMRHWEQYCFSEFYLKNPKWWFKTLISPRELRHVISDGVGMLKFLGEK